MQRWRRQRHPELIFWSREGISETRIRGLLLHCNGRRDVGDTARLLFQLLCVSVTLVVLRAQQPKI
jgi:hypothetical protein